MTKWNYVPINCNPPFPLPTEKKEKLVIWYEKFFLKKNQSQALYQIQFKRKLIDKKYNFIRYH